MSNWQTVLLEPAKIVLSQVSQFLVSLLLVLVILLIGWVIAKLIKTLVAKVLRIIKLDQISERIELDSVLAKGGIGYSLSELIAVVCYWIVMLVTFVVAINAIGLTVAADLLNKVVLYIPNIIAAVFILILGMFAATVLSNITQTAANNAGIAQSKLLGKVIEIVLMVFVIAISLEQLNIGAEIVKTIVTVVLASIGLSLALAFGLGCRDIAARFMAEFLDKIKTKK